jgi:hypothetical protein
MPRIVSDKAGGWWLGTVVFAFTLAFLLLGAKKMGTKGENGCARARIVAARRSVRVFNGDAEKPNHMD